MSGPSPKPAELEPDDSPLAAAEGNLGTVTDDEYFDSLAQVPAARDEAGESVNHREGVRDLRYLPPAERDQLRRELEAGR